MNLELLVSQSGNLWEVDKLAVGSFPLSVIYLVDNSLSAKSDKSALENLKESLQRDILRAKQIKRKIDEPFLDSCFAKWRHSLEETEWGQYAQYLTILALMAPPLCRAKELLLAIWGDVPLLQIPDRGDWHAIVPDATFKKETKSSFYRLRPTTSNLYLIPPLSFNSFSKLDQLFYGHSKKSKHSILELGQELKSAIGATHSWFLLRPVDLYRWPLFGFGQKLRDFAKVQLSKIKTLTLSRKKMATIATGILLSMLSTFFLLVYAKRSSAISSPLIQQNNHVITEDLVDEISEPDRSHRDKRFQPYSGWIAWLQKPLDQKIVKDRGGSSPIFISEAKSKAWGEFGERSGKIRPSESLSLQTLEEEIQRDLANLKRHRETLAQIAKDQGQNRMATADKSPTLNWFEEEQKRSEQHLLMAHTSLEKLSRRYGELPALLSSEPSQPEPLTRSDLLGKSAPHSTVKRVDMTLFKADDQIVFLQRTVPIASLTTLRQRLHFPFADWELPIIKCWIDQITGWDISDDKERLMR